MADRIDYRLPAGVLTADDDNFHAPPDDDWLQLETNWVWFFVPERKLGCWIYHFIRPTIGLDAGSSHGSVAVSSTTSTPPNWTPMFARNAG